MTLRKHGRGMISHDVLTLEKALESRDEEWV